MKIKKIHEVNTVQNITIAKKLAKKLAKKFFKKTFAFNRIHVDYNTFEPNVFNFYFVFDIITPDTIKNIQELLVFFSFNKDSWSFHIDDIGSDIREKAFYEMHLSFKNVNKYLEKLEIEDNTEKYNL